MDVFSGFLGSTVQSTNLIGAEQSDVRLCQMSRYWRLEALMERPVHTLGNLFAQLGRPSDDAAIQQFIATNRPLPGSVRLHEAACWTPAQAAFLCEAILDDSD